jgi:endo-1,4-beta-xylanase
MGAPRQARRSLGAIAACLAAAAFLQVGGCSSPGTDEGAGGSGGPASGGSTGGGGSGGSNAPAGRGGSTDRGGSTGVAGNQQGGPAGRGGGTAGTGGAAGATGGQGGSPAGGAGGGTVITGPGGATGTGGAKGGSSGTAGAGGRAGGAGGGNAGNGGAPSCPPATPLTGGKKYCSNSKGSVAGGNYAYELWADGGGSGCMTVYGVGAAFSANWTGVDDFLARVGLQFDETKTPTQLGTISADFAETKTGGDDGWLYVGIYGWTVSPLREYYILDDWGAAMPGGTASDGSPRTHIGTISVDGATYDVWKRTKTNAPAITGDNQTFDQYFSIRQTARQCGHISISEHFSQWAKLGLQMGKMEEAKILVEAQSNSGTVDFTTATVVVK